MSFLPNPLHQQAILPSLNLQSQVHVFGQEKLSDLSMPTVNWGKRG